MKRLSLSVPTLVALSMWTAAACAPDTPPASTDSAAESAPDPITAYAPTDDDEAAVVGTLQRLFDALASGDEALLRSVMDPSVVMHFSETSDGTTTFGSATVDALAERIRSSDVALIERMWDPIVVVEGALATIWTPYDFYVGDAFSHCGIDVATMMRTDDAWRIVALSWTRRQPPDCPLHPDGPPTR